MTFVQYVILVLYGAISEPVRVVYVSHNMMINNVYRTNKHLHRVYTYSSFSAKVTSTFIVRLLTLYFKGKDTSLGTICILYLQLQKRTKRCKHLVILFMKLIPHIHNFLCQLLFVHIYCLPKYNINNKTNRTYSIFY